MDSARAFNAAQADLVAGLPRLQLEIDEEANTLQALSDELGRVRSRIDGTLAR